MVPLIITLDGPAGSGKSTVARTLAKRLGFEFLDTGAMYRGLTAYCVDHQIDPLTMPDVVDKLAHTVPMAFDWRTDPPRLSIAGRDVTDRLRDADVTARVSDLSAIPTVRQVLVQMQRKIGQDHQRLVTEGRDQGSVVFPDAPVKFYLDANPQVRAKRRAEQLLLAGKPADESKILAAIIDRDNRDSTRTDGPLICPADAKKIDTSDLSLTQVVDLLQNLVMEKLDAIHHNQSTAQQRSIHRISEHA